MPGEDELPARVDRETNPTPRGDPAGGQLLGHPLHGLVEPFEIYDGIAELWWDSFADLEAATASPEGQTAGLALLEDERKFIDLSCSPLWFSEEKTVFG